MIEEIYKLLLKEWTDLSGFERRQISEWMYDKPLVIKKVFKVSYN